MRYKTYGSGKPLLLLHGFCLSDYSYQKFIHSLSKHYLVIVPHLSSGWKGNIADNLNGILLELKIQEPIILAGHSMGALLGAQYLFSYQKNVTVFIILNGLLIPLKQNRFMVFLSIIREFLIGLLRAGTKKAILRIVRDGLINVFNYFPILWKQTTYCIQQDISLKLPSIYIPVFILWGRQDGIINPRFANHIVQLIPHAQVELHDGGHAWFFIRSDECVTSINMFLNENQNKNRTTGTV